MSRTANTEEGLVVSVEIGEGSLEGYAVKLACKDVEGVRECGGRGKGGVAVGEDVKETESGTRV